EAARRDDSLFFLLFVLGIEDLDGGFGAPAAAGLADIDEFAVVVHGQSAKVACGNGDDQGAMLEAVEVDLDVLLLRVLLPVVLLVVLGVGFIFMLGVAVLLAFVLPTVALFGFVLLALVLLALVLLLLVRIFLIGVLLELFLVAPGGPRRLDILAKRDGE